MLIAPPIRIPGSSRAVIAGLDPAIHLSLRKKMDARVKPAHDVEREVTAATHAPTNFGTTVPFF
jgi:hypothetical protein